MPSGGELVRKVREAAAGLLGPEATCLAAVSGGPDSVALAAALAELAPEFSLKLGIAHFDHGIREASAREAKWTAGLAEELGLPFFTERGDVPALKEREKLSMEEAARKARYAFLERTALDWGAGHVATGHTADDQAETVLFRIIRGTGPAGLAGIPRSRPISDQSPQVKLIRPMLDCTREEVLEFLAARKLDYLTDETNFDVDSQARARIRHRLLPELAANYNPDIRAALARLAEGARAAQSALEALADERLKEAELCEEEVRLPLALLEGPQALCVEILVRASARALGGRAPGRARLAEAAERIARCEVGKRFELGELVAVRDYEHVIIRRAGAGKAAPSGWERPVAVPGKTELPVGVLRAERVARAGFDLAGFYERKSANEEVFDARLFTQEPVCRTRRAGDRFHPLGADGERKLKEFFIDEKVPRAARDSVPLVVLGGEILWVVGHRLSEAARVSEGAPELVRMEFVPAG